MSLRSHWRFEPNLTFLNHGSFGACPGPVLDRQQELRARIEANPMRFFMYELGALQDVARARVAAFVGADPDDLAFVTNATAGVNAVLRALDLGPGDELLTTTHTYNACKNTLDYVGRRSGARVVTASLPFPIADADAIVEPILAAVGPRTRLALLDHVTSPTGLVFPIARLVAALAERGVDTLVDGAHGPGLVPVDLREIGAAYYVGHGHKWLCGPKGAAFLYVRGDRQANVRPTVISHGATQVIPGRSRFRLEFDWAGTVDTTPFLCLPEAIDFVGGLVPGGWDEVRSRNRALALAARRRLCHVLGVAPPAPEELVAALVAIPLPDREAPPVGMLDLADPLQLELSTRFGIEVLVAPLPAAPRRVLRFTAHLYNDDADYERLAKALVALR